MNAALQPATAPAELPGPCQTHLTTVDRLPPKIETVAAVSSDVIIAKVADIGPAQWNTPSGEPPSDDEDYDAMHVFRLVQLTVESTAKGSPKTDLIAWVPGGTIGCHTFISDEVPEPLAKGDRLAVFLEARSPEVVLPIQALRSKQVWPIDSNSRVKTPVDGDISIETFTSRVKKG